MQRILEETCEQIRRLKAALYGIDQDLKNKEDSLRIGRYNMALKEIDLNLNIYHGTSRLDTSYVISCILYNWLRKITKNLALTDSFIIL